MLKFIRIEKLACSIQNKKYSLLRNKNVSKLNKPVCVIVDMEIFYFGIKIYLS